MVQGDAEHLPFYGVHPGSRLVHPTYREARRHTESPWWGTDGIRTKVGGMRHVPLAEFINAFVQADLKITPGRRAWRRGHPALDRRHRSPGPDV